MLVSIRRSKSDEATCKTNSSRLHVFNATVNKCQSYPGVRCIINCLIYGASDNVYFDRINQEITEEFNMSGSL